MKNTSIASLFIILVMCVLQTSCVTNTDRFDPNARAERVTRSGDNMGRILDAIDRINMAVEQGKMTPEEGNEMIRVLRRKSKTRN